MWRKGRPIKRMCQDGSADLGVGPSSLSSSHLHRKVTQFSKDADGLELAARLPNAQDSEKWREKKMYLNNLRIFLFESTTIFFVSTSTFFAEDKWKMMFDPPVLRDAPFSFSSITYANAELCPGTGSALQPFEDNWRRPIRERVVHKLRHPCRPFVLAPLMLRQGNASAWKWGKKSRIFFSSLSSGVCVFVRVLHPWSSPWTQRVFQPCG